MTPIRSDKYQYNWKPRYNNNKDIELMEQLKEIQQQQQLKKSELIRQALDDFVKYNKRKEK
jgi:hypothetical protein|tara:strand:- start:255 stop:437 length:183 start_codon:yes stop_codon:yes gene_type:complete